MYGIIPSETQQYIYNLKPCLQRSATTELLISAGFPLLGTLLIVAEKAVSSGLC